METQVLIYDIALSFSGLFGFVCGTLMFCWLFNK